MKRLLVVALLALFPLAALHAQETDTNNSKRQAQKSDEKSDNTAEEDGPRRFWQASLPGGNYMVAIDHIASVSIHEYLLDKVLIVNEVTIDAGGRCLARFYHIAPVTDATNSATAARVVEKGRELLDRAGRRAGVELHNMAEKTYPTTTHAGMVEYRILDLRDLDALYASVQQAWETGRGRKFTVK